MTKVIIQEPLVIESCVQCDYFDVGWCSHPDHFPFPRQIPLLDTNDIPDWCTLPEYE